MTAARKIDFDSNPTARKMLMQIFEEESRLLYPHEVAWILSMSISEVYEKVPRVRGLSIVRFDPRVIKEIKAGGDYQPETVETEVRNSRPKKRKKIDLCL